MARRLRVFWALVSVAAGIAGANGCSGKHRAFQEQPVGAADEDDDTTAEEGQDQGMPSGATNEGSDDPRMADPAEPNSSVDAPVGPRLAVAPLTLDLGPVVVELAAVRMVTVANTGDEVLPVPTVALVGGSDAEFSVLQNGCQDPLEPGDSCFFSAQFLPVQPGGFAGELLVDAADAGSERVTLSGTSLPAGDLILSPAEGSSAQFGAVRLGEPSQARLILVNPGTVSSGPLAISLNNPDFTLPSPGDGDCVPDVTELAPGASCTIVVTFTPSRRAPSEAILTVETPEIGSAGLRLDGVGSAPAVLTALQGELVVRAVYGQPVQATVTVENRGDEPVTLIGTSIEMDAADPEYTVVEGNCAGVLAGGASCQLVIEFKPSALGARPATLLVTPEAGEPLSIAIAGEGLKPGALTIAPIDLAAGDVIDFGRVRRNEERTVTFRATNPGAESTGLLQQITATGDFSVVTPAAGECSGATTLINGESCDLRVRFRPAVRGPRDGSLTIVSVGAGSVAAPLHGTGTVPADISSTPATVQLGSAVLNEQRTATVTVTNDGDETASAPQTQISGPGADAFSVTGCGAQLVAAATCQLTVAFSPTQNPAHIGLLTPSLLISSAAGGSANVALTARGLRPGSLDITAAAGASTAFQAVVNASQTQGFNVANTGGVDSGALSVSLTNPAGRRTFELVSSGQATACQTGQVLTPGASCSLSVAFRPVSAGTDFSATLSVTSSAAGTDSIALTGVAQALASLSSPAGAAAFPNGSASPEFVWRIDNNGDVATQPMTIGTIPAGFSLGTTGDCPFNQVAGLPAHSSCRVPVRFSPTQPPTQGRDQVVSGTLTISAGQLSVSLSMTGTIPRALAGRGQSCVVDADCQAGEFSICGSSGSSSSPNVCCSSACRDNPCNGCTAGANGGTCSPRGQGAECTTPGTSRAGICSTTNACTEFCILDQSLLDQCLLR